MTAQQNKQYQFFCVFKQLGATAAALYVKSMKQNAVCWLRDTCFNFAYLHFNYNYSIWS